MDNKDFIEHEHCPICTVAHPSSEEADKCFWSHNEIEKLRWVANCVHNIKIWHEKDIDLNLLDYDLFNSIEKITAEYGIDDQDY